MSAGGKRQKALQIILWIVLLGWLGLIFAMSAETGESSGGLSRRITQKVFEWIEKVITFSSEEVRSLWFDRMHFLIRKGAHFTEYAILGFLIFQLIKTYHLNHKKAYLFAVVCSAFYAATDEFHQGFTDGRSPQITDVGIDTMGAAFGCLTALLCWIFIERRKKRKERRDELER